ncbi:MAG: hypothetical protein RSA79_02185 [Oscillospiraceae bacterium]
MAVKIKNGVYETDNRGEIINISGELAIIEEVLIRLKVRKGSFCYDTSLGSELNLTDENADIDELFAIICEALSPINAVKVLSVSRDLNASVNSVGLIVEIQIFEINKNINIII